MKLKLAQVVLIVAIVFLLQRSAHVYGAIGFVKYPSNPIFQTNSNNWDSNGVHSPRLIKSNNLYQMWYSANGGSGWRIGYAYSPNGLTNWIRSSLPVIPPGSSDGWEKETDDAFVIYDSSNSLYKMWFTSTNSDHWQSGYDRFRTRYATSTDGISWTKLDWVITGTQGSWDSGGTARGRSVVYKDGVYHMWYAGTNTNDLGSDPYWRIGYATSTDGITWIKENQGNPVISPDKVWELKNVSYPNVIYINGIYHM